MQGVHGVDDLALWLRRLAGLLSNSTGRVHSGLGLASVQPWASLRAEDVVAVQEAAGVVVPLRHAVGRAARHLGDGAYTAQAPADPEGDED
eukprot:9834618-Lingulodinium_polyedra.AAC.1